MKIHDANDARRPVCINLPMRARMGDFQQSTPLVSLASCGETPDHPPTASRRLSVTVSRTVGNGQQMVNERVTERWKGEEMALYDPLNHSQMALYGPLNRWATAETVTDRGNRRRHTPTLAPAKLTAPLKWHGGKHYLARRIVRFMPPHTLYVEPYAGGLAVTSAGGSRLCLSHASWLSSPLLPESPNGEL